MKGQLQPAIDEGSRTNDKEMSMFDLRCSLSAEAKQAAEEEDLMLRKERGDSLKMF
jgi:hypothetical protein